MAATTKTLKKPRPASASNGKGTIKTLIDQAASAVGSIVGDGRRDAIQLLKEDHDRVQELFDKVKSTDEKRHAALFGRIKTELDVHTHIEETIFYPNLQTEGDKELVDLVREGIEEHRQAKMFLKEIEALKKDSPKFEAKLKVLIEDVEHHVSDEEDEMFPLVKDQFSREALVNLAVEMEREKRNFKKSLKSAVAN